jgi:hypothetical protein
MIIDFVRASKLLGKSFKTFGFKTEEDKKTRIIPKFA